jgi:hypothetical protein
MNNYNEESFIILTPKQNLLDIKNLSCNADICNIWSRCLDWLPLLKQKYNNKKYLSSYFIIIGVLKFNGANHLHWRQLKN